MFYVMGEQKCAFLRRKFPKLHFATYPLTMQELFATNPLSMQELFQQSYDRFRINPLHYHGDHCAWLKCCKLYHHYILHVV
jgi:hypothetical protein